MKWSEEIKQIMESLQYCTDFMFCTIPAFEVIKLGFIIRLKVKRIDWLLADTYPQAANNCALF